MLNRRRTRLSAKTILQWVFRRDQELVTCQLDIEPNASFRVSVVPHRHTRLSICERLDAAGKALMRHAEFADRLRSNGWTLIDYTNSAAA